jgi:hypothetical protein
MSFTAEVPRSGAICSLQVPPEDRELRIAALNHKPVIRAVGDPAANFASEFLESTHKILVVPQCRILFSLLADNDQGLEQTL